MWNSSRARSQRLPRLLCGVIGVVGLFVATTRVTHAEPFTLGNILVTHGKLLDEYTLDGELVQSIPVPHPNTSRYDVGDVVYDRYGRVHIVNRAPFDKDYISTFNPVTEEWTHTQVYPISGGSLDLSIFGNTLIRRGFRMSVDTFDIEVILQGPNEVSVGRDGLLYMINGGSPRNMLSRAERQTGYRIGEILELFNSRGGYIDGDGLTATASGEIYIAASDSRIYHFDKLDGHPIADIYTGANGHVDINMRSDGMLIAGSLSGDVVVTNTNFSSISTFNVGSHAYTAFVETPIPEPTTLTLAALGLLGVVCCRCRR
ncbi:MAG: PEP-CTERM sorting domain-containing protein [Pirellulales bacterium]